MEVASYIVALPHTSRSSANIKECIGGQFGPREIPKSDCPEVHPVAPKRVHSLQGQKSDGDGGALSNASATFRACQRLAINDN